MPHLPNPQYTMPRVLKVQSLLSLLLLSSSGSQEDMPEDLSAQQDTGAAWSGVKELLTHINETDQRPDAEIADTLHPPPVSYSVCYSAEDRYTQVFKRTPEGIWMASGKAIGGTVVEALLGNPDPLVRLMDPLCVLPCVLMRDYKRPYAPVSSFTNTAQN
jgi:hypothetical protein